MQTICIIAQACYYASISVKVLTMRQTKHRQTILDFLDHTPQALSATELHTALPDINLVTIYRNLESFVKSGLVTKLHLGKKEATYEKQHEPHHHAVCSDCQKVIHFTLDDENLKKEFSLPGFDIKNIEITLKGSCKKSHQEIKVKSVNRVQVK